MMKFAILFALVAAAVANPVTHLNSLSPTDRIVGGEPTTIDKVPYQVSIHVRGSLICGGSIISKESILTAAHCMNYPITTYSIRSGSSSSNSGGSTTAVSGIIMHEKYGTNNFGVPSFDIAIIKLLLALDFGSTRSPIPLSSEEEPSIPGSNAIVTGWGTTSQGGSVSPSLQTVTLPMISKSDCNAAYSSYGGLPKGQVCAAVAEGGKDACQGDSGGPLAIDGRLFGITSWGYGCALPGWPGVYTEVAWFRTWIRKNSGV